MWSVTDGHDVGSESSCPAPRVEIPERRGNQHFSRHEEEAFRQTNHHCLGAPLTKTCDAVMRLVALMTLLLLAIALITSPARAWEPEDHEVRCLCGAN